MEQGYYIKIFADMAVYLGIVPQGVLGTINESFGDDIKKNADLSNMNVSTVYLMQDLEDGCKARCAFCSQSADSNSARKESMLVDNLLIRYPMKMLVEKIKEGLLIEKRVERICIQTIYNLKTVENLLRIISELRSVTTIPLTACCVPVRKTALLALKSAGLDMITINYETATEELFDSLRGKGCGGPYRWDTLTECMNNAIEIFGRGNVGSHLQLGFGESARQALSHIQTLHNKGVFISLFAFQPLEGTRLQNHKRISYKDFHKVQMGSFLIQSDLSRSEDFAFDKNGQIMHYGITENELSDLVESGIPFRNKGCPGCNRIYYDTNPNERFYTYPRALTVGEISRIKADILSR